MHRNTIFVEKPAATSAYTGPGDIMPGAVFWAGLRGYNAAYATGSNPGVDIVDQAGNNPITINILADGTLDTATINSWVTAHGVTTILIAKLYDQSGNGNHFTQATNANRPVLTLNSIGTNNRPSIQRKTTSTAINVNSVQTITQAQPYFISSVIRCDESGGAYADTMSDNSGGNILQIGFSNSANLVIMYTGFSVAQAAGANTIPHAVQFTLDNPDSASEIYVDGTGTSVALGGTANLAAQTMAIPGSANAGQAVSIGEIGMWPGAATPAQKSQLNTNQRTTWYGF